MKPMAKTLCILALGGAMTLGLSQSLLAADDTKPAPPANTQGTGQGGAQRNNRPGGPAGGFRAMMNPYANQFDQMDKDLKLTDDQKTKIKTEVDAMNKDISDLQEDAAARGREIMQNAGDDRAAAMEKVQAEIKKTMADMQKIVDAGQTRINALLTPDQRVTWEGSKLKRTLQQRLGFMELTADQKIKVQALIDETAKSLAEAKDPAATAAAQGKLLKRIVADILTDDQAAKFITAGPGQMMMGGMGGGGGGARPGRSNLP